MISNALTLDWEPDELTPLDARLEVKIPSEKLPILIHELTHWSCFQTAIGQAFQELWDLIVAGSKNESVCRSIEQGTLPRTYRRALRNFKIALTLYQPWFEGAALFAQWDALSGQCKGASKGMSYANSLELLSSRFEDPHNGFSRLNAYLRSSRKSLAAHRDKIDLLALPIHSEKGFYLAGYLGVKAMYRAALINAPIFRDSDFFLSFFLSRVFHDPLAAAILLDTELEPAEWLIKLQSRLAERLEVFRESEISKLAYAYNEIEDNLPQRMKILAKRDEARGGGNFQALIGSHQHSEAATSTGDEAYNLSMGLSSTDWERLWRNIESARKALIPSGSKHSLEAQLRYRILSSRHRVMIRLRRIEGVAEVKSGVVTLRRRIGQGRRQV